LRDSFVTSFGNNAWDRPLLNQPFDAIGIRSIVCVTDMVTEAKQMSSVTDMVMETKQMNTYYDQDITKATKQMNTTYDQQQIPHLLQCYADWVSHYIDNGWQGYLLTFMFCQLPGSDASRMLTMRKHLNWFYGRLAKASVPKASSANWSTFLPRVILAPDLPVPKHSKSTVANWTMNSGIH
jgi:hypothetical protein